MPRRRPSIAPQDAISAIVEKYDELANDLVTIKSPKAASVQLVDLDKHAFGAQGEVVFDYVTETCYVRFRDEWIPLGSRGAKYEIKVTADDEDLFVGDGTFIWGADADLDTYYLHSASGYVTTAGSGLALVQIRNITQSTDMLTTRITIDSGELDSLDSGSQPVINTAVQIAAKDQLSIDIDAFGAGSLGLGIRLLFLPTPIVP